MKTLILASLLALTAVSALSSPLSRQPPGLTIGTVQTSSSSQKTCNTAGVAPLLPDADLPPPPLSAHP